MLINTNDLFSMMIIGKRPAADIPKGCEKVTLQLLLLHEDIFVLLQAKKKMVLSPSCC